MQMQRFISWIDSLHLRMGDWRTAYQFLMAGRREEQGTAPLPPIFPWMFPSLLESVVIPQLSATSILSTTLPNTTFMAGRDGAKGTSPLPPYHLPVLPAEVCQWMAPSPDDIIIDGTLGGGGHTELFLKKGSTVLAIDRDPDAIAHTSQRFINFRETFQPWQANYAEMPHHPYLSDGKKVDGILLDLGVSSHQLDCAERGFSFQKDGPLDMRMGPDAISSAADFINQATEQEMIDCFRSLGEEPQAQRIARAIIQERKNTPFTRTLELAGAIERLIGRHGKTHPATRCFQAIRMHINQEIPKLHQALHAALTCLKPGGKLLIITFHSLEDTAVKKFLHFHAQAEIDHPTWPSAKPNPEHYLTLPIRKSIAATRAEILSNPRSRSAKLRVANRNHTPLLPTP
jgi:16S rRNA (cytosine1402-N4)-methyltransferase